VWSPLLRHHNSLWSGLQGGLVWNDASHVTAPGLQSLHGLWRIRFELGATQQYYPSLHSAFWLEDWILTPCRVTTSPTPPCTRSPEFRWCRL